MIVMANSTKTTLVLAKMMISMSRIHVTQVKTIEVKMIIVEQFGSQFSLQD